jgi:RNA recognition motif-containing protein
VWQVLMPDQAGRKFQRIQIGNLGSGAIEVHLRSLFLAYGHVISYERPLDPATGRPGSYAFIEMASDAADAAVAALNGREVGGVPLQIVASEPVAGSAPDSERHPRAPQQRRTVLAPAAPPPSDNGGSS